MHILLLRHGLKNYDYVASFTWTSYSYLRPQYPYRSVAIRIEVYKNALEKGSFLKCCSNIYVRYLTPHSEYCNRYLVTGCRSLWSKGALSAAAVTTSCKVCPFWSRLKLLWWFLCTLSSFFPLDTTS